MRVESMLDSLFLLLVSLLGTEEREMRTMDNMCISVVHVQ